MAIPAAALPRDLSDVGRLRQVVVLNKADMADPARAPAVRAALLDAKGGPDEVLHLDSRDPKQVAGLLRRLGKRAAAAAGIPHHRRRDRQIATDKSFASERSSVERGGGCLADSCRHRVWPGRSEFKTLSAGGFVHCLSTAFSLPCLDLSLPFPLPFHCLSLTFHCLSLSLPFPFTAFPPLPFHCLSLTFHCLFYCLFIAFP